MHYEDSAKEWDKYSAEEISAVRKAVPAARKKSPVHIAKHLGEIETKLRGCKNITGKWMVHQQKEDRGLGEDVPPGCGDVHGEIRYDTCDDAGLLARRAV